MENAFVVLLHHSAVFGNNTWCNRFGLVQHSLVRRCKHVALHAYVFQTTNPRCCLAGSGWVGGPRCVGGGVVCVCVFAFPNRHSFVAAICRPTILAIPPRIGSAAS